MGQFVAVGNSVASTSPDGVNWTPRTAKAKSWNTVCWSPVEFTF